MNNLFFFGYFQGCIVGSFSFSIFGWLIGALGHDAGITIVAFLDS